MLAHFIATMLLISGIYFIGLAIILKDLKEKGVKIC
jgi:hypothetical protein